MKKTSRPPRRSSRAASGIHLRGSAQSDAPYSETARSNDASGSGTASPGASTSGNSRPVSCIMRRAVASCAGVGSTPVTRAPRRASQEPKYAVPQPSSTTSRPFTSGSDTDLLLRDREHAPENPLVVPAAARSGRCTRRSSVVHSAMFAAIESSSSVIAGAPPRSPRRATRAHSTGRSVVVRGRRRRLPGAARATRRPRSRSRAGRDPLAVREVVLDPGVRRPLRPPHPEELRWSCLGRDVLLRHAEVRERRVREEDEPPAGTQQARRLGDPLVRDRPRARRRTPRARGRTTHLAAAPPRRGASTSGNMMPGLRLHAPRRRELRRRRVNTDRPCPAPREPRRRSTRCRSRARRRRARRHRRARRPRPPESRRRPRRSPRVVPRCARAAGSVNSAFVSVHCAMFAAIVSVGSGHRSCAAQISSLGHRLRPLDRRRSRSTRASPRRRRRLQLDEPHDLEPVLAQQRDPVAVREADTRCRRCRSASRTCASRSCGRSR